MSLFFVLTNKQFRTVSGHSNALTYANQMQNVFLESQSELLTFRKTKNDLGKKLGC